MSADPVVGQPRVGVVTVVSGRHDHLRAQREHLAASVPAITVHCVVAVDDPAVDEVTSQCAGLETAVLHCPTTIAGLPIARARNLGAAAAIENGVDVVLFLDVDCLPGADLVTRLTQAVLDWPDALLCAPVTYLPPPPDGGWTPSRLAATRRPHPARPNPPAGQVEEVPPALFWSLCFAVASALWARLGGFHEGYLGYGGEDTDLGACAERAGVPVLMVGGADAFHQHHAVSDPPVEHVDDILRNSRVFARRHGRVPMRGWLDAFADRGLIDALALRRVDAPRVASVPPVHPYVDAVTPGTVVRVDPLRVTGWEPDPLLHPEILQARAERIDVVHLHFGYDRMSEDAVRHWLDVRSAAAIRLVVTVHDVRNPHHESRERHDGHLRLLLAAADDVLTLTDAAASELSARYGRHPIVVAHPPLTDKPASAGPRDHVLVPLKALRRNVCDPVRIVAAVSAGAARAGMRARVMLEPHVVQDARLTGLDHLDVDLDVSPYLPHHEVCARVAAARACVLPYRFGSHSGWVELCRDAGTRVVVPDCGHYVAQWEDAISYVNNERDGLDDRSLTDAVAAACSLPLPPPADPGRREAQLDEVLAVHDVLYRAGRR